MADFLRDEDLDRLVRDLNQSTRAAVEPPSQAAVPETLASAPRRAVVREGEPLEEHLRRMVALGATDLLLISGMPVVHRVNGTLERGDGEDVDEVSLREGLAPYLGAHGHRAFETQGFVDFSVGLDAAEDDARWHFRVNLHRQRGRLAAAIRALPGRIPTLAELGLPGSLADLVKRGRGLVLVCGPTGSGKTSTLAALIRVINETRPCHIVTIEDPVEYHHPNRQAVIEQVEVGSDAPSFALALKSALRQDPDVILVGEMRDLETTATALTAAETGHLILATLHTNDAAQTVNRMVDVFSPLQQAQIRHQLALSLSAIVCQQLVRRADGKGRVPALEVLVATYAVRQHIRSQHLENLYNEVTLGRRHGMVSFEESLAALVRSGAVASDEARLRAPHPEELARLLDEPL